ncbi:hypothetical protein AYO44_15615 [Planctomycetaceae bacterium SCGC AG-212-F19]|nr:hypothetical protein AYO44_15615 [Planctomycetaceae bacterium SCGC AG-212-F19]
MTDLTPRQRAVYELLRSSVERRGFQPNTREMCAHFGISSPNGVPLASRYWSEKNSFASLTASPANRPASLFALRIVAAAQLPQNIADIYALA